MNLIPLSRRTIHGLNNLNSYGEEICVSLCKFILQTVITGESSIAVDPSHNTILTSLSTLLLEAAKIQANAEQVRTVLQEQRIHDNIANAIIEIYVQYCDTLTQHMNVTGINLPMIVDIDWRLDYSVRSRQGGAVNKPMFFVCLKVKDRGLLRNIDMIASQEELQDLHNKVRDAVKQVERVLNTI